MALLKVRWTGVSPLMMHNAALANPLNKHAKALKAVSGKRKKTDDDYAEMSRIEFMGGLYCDDKIGPYVQGVAVKASIIAGAKLSKGGKLVNEAVLISEMKIPLKYAGPRTPDKLWDLDTKHVDVRGVVIGRVRIMRTRPIFPEWSLEFSMDYASDRIDEADLIGWMETAGRFKGLGDYRPTFGRYEVTVL